MDRYTRILVVIFLLILSNLGLSFYILSKLNRPVQEKQIPVVVSQKTATPSSVATTPPTIQSDLNQIKAEIRALRESLDSSGLILVTPEP